MRERVRQRCGAGGGGWDCAVPCAGRERKRGEGKKVAERFGAKRSAPPGMTSARADARRRTHTARLRDGRLFAVLPFSVFERRLEANFLGGTQRAEIKKKTLGKHGNCARPRAATAAARCSIARRARHSGLRRAGRPGGRFISAFISSAHTQRNPTQLPAFLPSNFCSHPLPFSLSALGPVLAVCVPGTPLRVLSPLLLLPTRVFFLFANCFFRGFISCVRFRRVSSFCASTAPTPAPAVA